MRRLFVITRTILEWNWVIIVSVKELHQIAGYGDSV